MILVPSPIPEALLDSLTQRVRELTKKAHNHSSVYDLDARIVPQSRALAHSCRTDVLFGQDKPISALRAYLRPTNTK
jgi:hypothetical protein